MKAIHIRPSLRKANAALFAMTVLLLLLRATGLALAQEPDYTLEWWTVDGGGAVAQNGISCYTLGGAIGQPDAGVLGDGEYTLTGGFWVGGVGGHRIYLPLVLRNH